jgi:hypothetical protein
MANPLGLVMVTSMSMPMFQETLSLVTMMMMTMTTMRGVGMPMRKNMALLSRVLIVFVSANWSKN